ncbi:hypothetical protein Tco_0660903, partial [Tanacetum coccineum]
LKLLEFGEFAFLVLLFLFPFSSYKSLSGFARLALEDCYEWIAGFGLGFDWGLTFLASALYSSDSRVRACSHKWICVFYTYHEVISQEDANLKLLKSLPSAWNNIALIMRNKSDLDTLSMDDLYNNMKVYEYEIKGQLSSSSNSQNVAFVSSENTSNTNKAVNTAHEVSTASSQGQAFSLTYVDNVMFSFFANQSNSPQLDNEDIEQIDTDDLKEMDLKWRGHFTRECRAPRNQGNRNGDAPRRIVPVETHANALVV